MLLDLFHAARSGDAEGLKWAVASVLLALPIIILSLSVHEAMHGYVAYKLGDPTAKSFGRLTLNPLKHLDPIGFLCMLIFGFGFAKPVPINSRYFKKPRRDMALAAAAGPLSNIGLGLIFAIILRLFLLLPTENIFLSSELGFWAYYFIVIFLQTGIQLNIALAVFNLIPCPPLDGSKILYMFLPPNLYYKALQYERYIYFALLLVLATGVLSPVISFLTDAVTDVIFKLLFFN